MLTREEAEEIARAQVTKLGQGVPGGVALMPESTIAKAYGWVFFFNSKRFLETRDPFSSLLGNSPFLVEAEGGRITLLGTSRPVADSLKRLEIQMGFASEG